MSTTKCRPSFTLSPYVCVLLGGEVTTNLDGFVVFGDIEAKWLASGGANGPLGHPVSNEAPTFDHTGRAQNFQHGIMSWHPNNPAPKAFFIWGLIGRRWIAIGREQFGYPITDELVTTSNPLGRYNHLRAYHPDGSLIGESSIFWLSDTGAHEIYGGIRDFWARQGWDGGRLGFPINAEHNGVDSSQREEQFQHGMIAWPSATGAFLAHPLIHLQDNVNSVLVSGSVSTPNSQVDVTCDYRDDFGFRNSADSPQSVRTDANGGFSGIVLNLTGSGLVRYINVRAIDVATKQEATGSLRGDA